jgi:hypothetical protein
MTARMVEPMVRTRAHRPTGSRRHLEPAVQLLGGPLAFALSLPALPAASGPSSATPVLAGLAGVAVILPAVVLILRGRRNARIGVYAFGIVLAGFNGLLLVHQGPAATVFALWGIGTFIVGSATRDLRHPGAAPVVLDPVFSWAPWMGRADVPHAARSGPGGLALLVLNSYWTAGGLAAVAVGFISAATIWHVYQADSSGLIAIIAAPLFAASIAMILLFPAARAWRLWRAMTHGAVVQAVVTSVQTPRLIRPAPTVDATVYPVVRGTWSVAHPRGAYRARFATFEPWARDLRVGSRVDVLVDSSAQRIWLAIGLDTRYSTDSVVSPPA